MKKTVMNYNLAKALMEAGMEHFDVGGPVTMNPNTGVGNQISQGASQGIQTILSPVTGILGGISTGLTHQNQYQADLAPISQSDYGGVINVASNRALEDYQNALKIRQQQQMLADLLGQQVQGGGPNPAQMELAQNTANTIEAQRALQAGQRGAGSNVGLIAKQAGQQGAQIQQQGNNMAALLRARQQLAAQDALARQQATMAQGIGAQQQLNANLFGTAAQAQNAQNAGQIENYKMAQGLNRQTASENAAAINKRQKSIIENIPAIGKFIGGIFGAEGGEVPEHVSDIAQVIYPEHFESMGGKVGGRGEVSGDSLLNDRVPAVLSPGEVVLPRSVTMSPDAPSKAAEFMAHLQRRKSIKEKGYGAIAERKRAKK